MVLFGFLLGWMAGLASLAGWLAGWLAELATGMAWLAGLASWSAWQGSKADRSAVSTEMPNKPAAGGSGKAKLEETGSDPHTLWLG